MLTILVSLVFFGPLAFLSYKRRWMSLLILGGILALLVALSFIINWLADYVIFIYLAACAVIITNEMRNSR